jgi:hypothetical protein
MTGHLIKEAAVAQGVDIKLDYSQRSASITVWPPTASKAIKSATLPAAANCQGSRSAWKMKSSSQVRIAHHATSPCDQAGPCRLASAHFMTMRAKSEDTRYTHNIVLLTTMPTVCSAYIQCTHKYCISGAAQNHHQFP